MSASESQAIQLLVVASGSEGVYADISRELEADSQFSPGEILVTTIGDDSLDALLASAARIVTIGTQAADAVYAIAPGKPVISALVTGSGFSHLVAKHFGSEEVALEQGISVLLLDQPLQRLYRLGKLILPEATDVGVIATDTGSSANAARILGAGGDSEMHFTVATLDAASSPINTLTPVIASSDFVIALPGKRSITVSAARWILKISSHQRTPVIAYSRKYAVSGAMAAVYASPADVARELLSLLEDSAAVEQERGKVYPSARFSVEINRSVARALGIPVRDAQYYHQAITRLESEP